MANKPLPSLEAHNQHAHAPGMQLYMISFPDELTEKAYIGITSKDAQTRFKQHCSSNKNYPIVQAIKKYGKESAIVTVLGEFDNWDALYAAEQAAIETRQTRAPNGFNLTDGGRGAYGLPASQERKDKIAAAHRGRKMSEEQRRKISEAQKGRDNSKQVAAMMAANRGKPASPDQRQRLDWTGRQHTDEARAKMAAAKRGRASNFAGRTHSEETKLKLSLAAKARLARKREGMCQPLP